MERFVATLAKIKSRGYWKVSMHPLAPPEKRLATLPEVKQVLRQAVVSLRGWDYPHLPLGSDDRNAIYPLSDRVEAWTDYQQYKEVLRFYDSALFVHLLGFREDWFSEETWLPKGHFLRDIPPGTVLDFTGVIFSVTEIFLFARNLVQSNLYDSGISISIELHGTRDRQLTALDPMRMMGPGHVSETEPIVFPNEEYAAAEISANYRALAESRVHRIFHLFQWDRPSPDLIQSEQRRLIERRF